VAVLARIDELEEVAGREQHRLGRAEVFGVGLRGRLLEPRDGALLALEALLVRGVQRGSGAG
jgi:hypothetical protein